MAVWNDQSKILKDELKNSVMIRKYLSQEEIDFIFDSKKMLKNVDFIFNRTVEAD
jgi:adenylosuccinate lyase